MIQRFHLTQRSENVKTGPIATSTSCMGTCPKTCALYSKCYGWITATKYHWYKVSDGRNGFPFENFVASVRALRPGTLLRHNVTGDLFGENTRINGRRLNAFVQASKHLVRWTYTHKPVIASGRVSAKVARENRAKIRKANRDGFSVNLSADNLAMADKYIRLGIAPVTSIVAHDYPNKGKTPAGHRVIVCPAQTHESVTCEKCRICAFRKRNYVVGFRAHSQNYRTIEILTNNCSRAG